MEEKKDLKMQDSNDQYKFGEYIYEVLKEHNENKILNNDKLWNWLICLFFEIVFHKKARGISEHRYILSDSWFTRYRHLVRTPWYILQNLQRFFKIISFWRNIFRWRLYGAMDKPQNK